MNGPGIIHRYFSVLVGFSFEKMGMNRIAIRCAVGNLPSEKTASRLGFTFEGIERGGERFHNSFFDLRIFSLLKSESLSS